MNNKTSHFCDSSIVEFYEEHTKSQDKPMVVLCKNNDHAERVAYTLDSLCDANTIIIPDTETLPYDEEFPQDEILSKRMSGINQLCKSTHKKDVFLITVRSLAEKIPNSDFYTPCFQVQISQSISLTVIEKDLLSIGYKKVPTVRGYGQFSINPNTIDVHAFGEKDPTRAFIDKSTGKVSKIYSFSKDTQLNDKPIEIINIFPSQEFPFNEESINKFRFRYRRQFSNHNTNMLEKVKNGVLPRGIDYFKPLFTDTLFSILDFMPDTARIVSLVSWESEADINQNAFNSRYNEISDNRQVLEPSQILHDVSEISEMLKRLSYIAVSNETKRNKAIEENGVRKQEKIHQTFKLINEAHLSTNKTLITINTETRLRQLEMMFMMKGVKFKTIDGWDDFISESQGYFVTKLDLDYGYINKHKNFTLITEFEIFDSKTIEEHSYDNELETDNIIEFIENDPVVHAKYGVGRFLGFETFNDGNSEKEYAVIEYAENSKIFVALSDMHLLSEYKGIDPENIPLDDASSKNWNKHLLSAIKDVKQMAHKLLNIKAKRLSIKRLPYSVPTFEYRKFANEFPFAITEDQGKTIKSIIKDLEGDIAMDRLVVGDVGYGKTEVAMRAAMIVSSNKRQCSILAPTTLLAEQHYESFKERFSGMNLNIELLTRENKSQERAILKGLKDGIIDIVIGTHRLIQKDVDFNDLGLLVVDEEHRFGVKQKEDINKKRGSVDILSLSATPIPRTLSLTMHGVRDISTIMTAPQKRLAVRTIAEEVNENSIVDALKRELGRNGQAFYLYNDTKGIEDKANELSDLLPDARVLYAHGQMKERELQEVMQKFRSHEFDILVATTVIETGIDIPNANTMIIEAAEKFGLSQLHQLRGRVGRANRQAYTYLITSKDAIITDRAKRRLKAMEDNNNLGGGFKISNADLEIRGAGEILGESQSGHIQEIGYQMYFSLLEKAIGMLDKGEDLDELNGHGNELMFYIPASHNIPFSYISDKGLRASYYKSISELTDVDSSNSLVTEMENRFGELPESANDLIKLIVSKASLIMKGLKKIKLNKSTIETQFKSNSVAKEFAKNCERSGITIIQPKDNTVTIPFKFFDRDGVIDYVKINELIE